MVGKSFFFKKLNTTRLARDSLGCLHEKGGKSINSEHTTKKLNHTVDFCPKILPKLNICESNFYVTL